MALNKNSIIMLGATGAVGSEALNTLLLSNNVNKITLLGRRNSTLSKMPNQ